MELEWKLWFHHKRPCHTMFCLVEGNKIYSKPIKHPQLCHYKKKLIKCSNSNHITKKKTRMVLASFIPHIHQLSHAAGRAEGATHLLEHRRPELLCKYSSVNCQFLSDPFTKPDTTMKPRTRTLTQVNTLLTIADSFTPTVKSPENVHTQETWSINLIPGKSFLGWGREWGRWLNKNSHGIKF